MVISPRQYVSSPGVHASNGQSIPPSTSSRLLHHYPLLDMSSASQQPICAIDPLSLIINEIILVTSAMRKSARWSSGGVAAILGGSVNGDNEDEGLAVRWGLRRGKRASQTAESTLMAEFSKLRSELADCKGTNPKSLTPVVVHADVEILQRLTCLLYWVHFWL